jgi:hypothetical protein
MLWAHHWRTLWKQRNHNVFGHDAATIALAEKKEVAQRLVQIPDQKFHMEPSAQSLLAQIFSHISNIQLG